MRTLPFFSIETCLSNSHGIPSCALLIKSISARVTHWFPDRETTSQTAPVIEGGTRQFPVLYSYPKRVPSGAGQSASPPGFWKVSLLDRSCIAWGFTLLITWLFTTVKNLPSRSKATITPSSFVPTTCVRQYACSNKRSSSSPVIFAQSTLQIGQYKCFRVVRVVHIRFGRVFRVPIFIIIPIHVDPFGSKSHHQRGLLFPGMVNGPLCLCLGTHKRLHAYPAERVRSFVVFGIIIGGSQIFSPPPFAPLPVEKSKNLLLFSQPKSQIIWHAACKVLALMVVE